MIPETALPRLPDIDFTEASRHCQLLDPENGPHIFAVFREAPDATHWPQHHYGQLADVLDKLNAAQKAGCGVFIAINKMRGPTRRKSHLERIRALQRDVDCTPVPQLPLPPSLRVVTSPGRWQDYLLTDPNDPLKPEEAERINRNLADEYGGDRQATDVTRLFRLAGSWHLKGEPFRVRIIGGHGRRYARAELLGAFPAPPPRRSLRQRPATTDEHNDRYVAAAIRSLQAELAEAQQGHRNATLNWCVFRLGQLGISCDETAVLLKATAEYIGLSHREFYATLQSGWRAGAAKPMTEEVAR